MTAALSVRRLEVRLGGRLALAGVELAIAPGELVALIGPNGAGKSTFLRAICGLVPAAGSIEVAGRRLSGMSRRLRARSLAYLPQLGRAHWPISVRELVSLGRIPYSGLGAEESAEDEQAIVEALASCGLLDLADKSCAEISGGELARALLARTLAVRAPLLLADEPVAALDPSLQLAAMKRLRKEASSGVAVLVVLHDVPLAMRFADRLIGLSEGRLQADGAPLDLLRSGSIDRLFGVRFVSGVIEGQLVASPLTT